MPPHAILPTNSGIQHNNNNIHNSHSARFYELLDALKMEYDLVLQFSGTEVATHKMSPSEYEIKGTNMTPKMTIV